MKNIFERGEEQEMNPVPLRCEDTFIADYLICTKDGTVQYEQDGNWKQLLPEKAIEFFIDGEPGRLWHGKAEQDPRLKFEFIYTLQLDVSHPHSREIDQYVYAPIEECWFRIEFEPHEEFKQSMSKSGNLPVNSEPPRETPFNYLAHVQQKGVLYRRITATQFPDLFEFCSDGSIVVETNDGNKLMQEGDYVRLRDDNGTLHHFTYGSTDDGYQFDCWRPEEDVEKPKGILEFKKGDSEWKAIVFDAHSVKPSSQARDNKLTPPPKPKIPVPSTTEQSEPFRAKQTKQAYTVPSQPFPIDQYAETYKLTVDYEEIVVSRDQQPFPPFILNSNGTVSVSAANTVSNLPSGRMTFVSDDKKFMATEWDDVTQFEFWDTHKPREQQPPAVLFLFFNNRWNVVNFSATLPGKPRFTESGGDEEVKQEPKWFPHPLEMENGPYDLRIHPGKLLQIYTDHDTSYAKLVLWNGVETTIRTHQPVFYYRGQAVNLVCVCHVQADMAWPVVYVINDQVEHRDGYMISGIGMATELPFFLAGIEGGPKLKYHEGMLYAWTQKKPLQFYRLLYNCVYAACRSADPPYSDSAARKCAEYWANWTYSQTPRTFRGFNGSPKSEWKKPLV